MAIKTFRLTRVLRTGLYGEDVRKFQHWLNIVQEAYGFSKSSFTDGIPENGNFSRYVTTCFYHRFLDMMGYDTDQYYDAEVHADLCYNVNMALQVLGRSDEVWVCR